MKKLVKYLVAVLITVMCIYGFWVWLQYKWATVIKKNTLAIITELHEAKTLQTAHMYFTKTIEGEEEVSQLLPDMGIEQIITSALFNEKIILEIQWDVYAGYIFETISEDDISVSRDGTIILTLWEPEILWIQLSWEIQANQLGITPQHDIEIEKLLRAKASELMIQEALNWGILEEVKKKSPTIIQNLLLNAHIQIKEVILTWTHNGE